MSYEIKAYKYDKEVMTNPLSIKREWFDNSPGKTAYKCLPISSANVVGWGISFPEDISFIWDGQREDFANHVKKISGEKYFRPQDNGTIAFLTDFCIETEENVSIMIMPVPNQFSDSWATISATFSTSFYRDNIQPGIVILKSNEIITIKAGTPIAAFIPISFSQLDNSTLEVKDWDEKDFSNYNDDYADAMGYSMSSLDLAGFYRNAVNHKKEKIGKHEVTYLNLKTIFGNKDV